MKPCPYSLSRTWPDFDQKSGGVHTVRYGHPSFYSQKLREVLLKEASPPESFPLPIPQNLPAFWDGKRFALLLFLFSEYSFNLWDSIRYYSPYYFSKHLLRPSPIARRRVPCTCTSYVPLPRYRNSGAVGEGLEQVWKCAGKVRSWLLNYL